MVNNKPYKIRVKLPSCGASLSQQAHWVNSQGTVHNMDLDWGNLLLKQAPVQCSIVENRTKSVAIREQDLNQRKE